MPTRNILIGVLTQWSFCQLFRGSASRGVGGSHAAVAVAVAVSVAQQTQVTVRALVAVLAVRAATVGTKRNTNQCSASLLISASLKDNYLTRHSPISPEGCVLEKH